MKFVHILICTWILSTTVFGQSENPNSNLDLQSTMTLEEILSAVEQQSEFFFVYNTQNIPLTEVVILPQKEIPLSQLLKFISETFALNYTIEEATRKIIITPSLNLIVRGQLLDSLSSESLIGAIIYSKNKTAITNIDGYFVIEIERGNDTLTFHNMGYLKKQIVLDKLVTEDLEVRLSPILDFDIIITPDPIKTFDQKERINLKEVKENIGILGNGDLISYLKNSANVSIGSEGQNGYTVRGGGPHQNLILMDGLPIYEGSHLGGMSSVFLPGAIKSIDLYKSDFPARFGGKLSSVLDVHLNDGNRNKFTREVSVGLEGLTAHIDGPISENTTVNINGKLSWFSHLASSFLKYETDYEEINLNYSDLYFKLSHWFNPKNKISFSVYTGEDLVKLSRDQMLSQTNGFRDFNRIAWGNNLFGFEWKLGIGKNTYLNTNIGISKYNFNSRGSYEILFPQEDTTSSEGFEIQSISKLKDIVFSEKLDIYTSNIGTFTLGMNYTLKDNSPSINERDIFGDPNVEPTVFDTTYNTNEFVGFIENRYALTDKLEINSGLRYVLYDNSDINYSFFEPRFNLSYKSKNSSWDLSYARLSQFIHLLSNPGPGLPSDLWAPSTGNIPPERSNVFAFDFVHSFIPIEVGFSVFYKDLTNVIEYTDASDIIYSVLIDEEIYQIQVNNELWEERVSIGKGESYGFETFFQYKTKKLSARLNYALTKATRVFDNIDQGESFPYKYDNTHNISSQISYRFSKNKTLTLNWVFSTGNTYTISDIRVPTPDGGFVLEPSSRNNFRIPAFHHLDLHYSHKKILDGSRELIWDIGLYNVYNEANPFYEYLSQDHLSSKIDIVSISIYPILPQFSLTYKW